ncbi:MAG TPA: hypothetical protein VKG78_00285 [Opitutaceae bacterium]|nr:hypothetical protein [Opitutaceae bacterium]
MNVPAARWSVAALLVVLLAACAKKPDSTQSGARSGAVGLVPETERSRHFEAVSGHLELGGVLYGYVDVDGDVLALAGSAQTVVGQIAAAQPQLSKLAKQDFKALVSDLGLTDVKAIGLSSVREAGGTFRNRAFLYTPEGRHGLFAVFGGQPGRFVGARLAPPDADFYAEHEFDIVAVYDTVKALVAKVNGPEAADAFEKAMKKAGAQSQFSLLDLIEGLNGRAIFIARLDPAKTVALPGPKPVNIPAFSALVRIDGIGPAVEAALAARSAQLEASQEGSLHLFTCKGAPPIEGLKYVFAVDGKALYAATSADFLRECLKRSEGLDTNPAFVAGLAALGPEGNGLTWVAPRFFSRLKELSAINAQSSADVRKLLDLYAANLPAASQPLLAVRTNLPDGILVRSAWNRSLKADVAMLTVYNPLTVGLLAAMAIPAFQKVRVNSQTMAVTNNLRMLAAAADQYYLEHGASSPPTYDDLVGPDKMIKALVPVAGEDYRALDYQQGRLFRVVLGDGRTVTYPRRQPNSPRTAAARSVNTPRPDAVARQSDAIMENLRTLDEAANRYYAEHDTTTATLDQLAGPGNLVPHLESVSGEDYHSVLFKKGRPLRLYLKDGRVIVYPP